MSFWYNTATGQVETDDNRGQAQDVMGPYETEAEAAKALQTAHERTEKWDQEDRQWNTGGATSDDGED